MERTFALIMGTSVVNSIVADDSYIDYIRNQYTDIVETTDMDFIPGTGMAYNKDTNEFLSTAIYAETEEIIDAELVQKELE